MSTLVAQPQEDSITPSRIREEVLDHATSDDDDDNLSTSSSLTSPSMASVQLGYSGAPHRDTTSYPLSIDIARDIQCWGGQPSMGLIDVHPIVSSHNDPDEDDDHQSICSTGTTCSTKNQDKTDVRVELMGTFEPLVITTHRSTAWGLAGHFAPRFRLRPAPRRALRAARLVLARRKMALLIREHDTRGDVDEEEEEIQRQPRKIDREPRYLQILRQHPELAKDRFRRKVALWGDDFLIFPLSFCVEVGAPLSVVQEVFDMFPEALSQPVAPLEGDFLLHLACSQLYRTPKDVIMFLAQAYPDGVRKEDLDGFLPLHRLLFKSSASSSLHGTLTTRNASLQEVQTLLEIYPSSMLQNCFGSPLLLALDGELERNGTNFADVLACLIANFPAEARSLELGERIVTQPKAENTTSADDLLEAYYLSSRPRRSAATGSRKQYGIMTLEHAYWVSKILPQLTSLCCTPRLFAPRALLLILRNCASCSYMKELDLHVPHELLINNEAVCSSLYQLLRQNKTLTSLKLDFGAANAGNDNKDNNHHYLEQCIASLGKGLCENEMLQMVLIVIADKVPPQVLDHAIWEPLAGVLRSSNTSLEYISIPQPSTGTFGNNGTENDPPHENIAVVGNDSVSMLLSPPPPAQKRVLFWTRLNRSGRALARDPYLTRTGFANLLVTVMRQQQCAIQIINQRRATTASSTQPATGEVPPIGGLVMHNTFYGLLLESPNCWSGTTGGP